MKKRRIELVFLAVLAGCAPKTPSAQPELPDANSPGAALVTGYCTECHGAPMPSLHSEKEWAAVVRRMQNWRVTKGMGAVPEKDEAALIGYLQKHGRPQ